MSLVPESLAARNMSALVKLRRKNFGLLLGYKRFLDLLYSKYLRVY